MKILKLPLLALESVLLNCELCDLVQFTFLSKRCFHIAMRMKTPLAVLDIDVSKRFVKCIVRFGKVKKFEWWHYCEENRLRRVSVASIGHRQIETLQFKGRIFSMKEANDEECAKEITNYLEALFHCSIRVVSLFPDDIIAPQRSMLTFYNECQKIYMEGKQKMTYDELWDILENWKPSEKIMINLKIDGENKKLLKWTSPKSLSIYGHSQWINIDMLLNLECINLFDCGLTENDIKVFINHWFHSAGTHFRRMELRWVFPAMNDLTFETLDLEIPLMPYSKERRNRNHICSPFRAINCEDGMDILRGDGLLATVKIFHLFFYFCVWHDRFPDMTGIHIMYPYEPPRV
ncbi:hypothetical protein CAEBREN_03663 [Caenorhabditis brenneri]|uniref:Sdz-33 F-box domain-containing protein n=1 Tax=Caenorhabditis brenneri TaxID=135651 RepID=G0MFA0_CAEBE|nr:hypothetical protein CAEBREN_03663 [Caenorhabditis brenneri]